MSQTTIGTSELRHLLDDPHEDQDVTVVDALPPAPYSHRHLPGAVNVTAEHTDHEVRATLTDPAARIVVYSTDPSCNRGPDLADGLTRLGYTSVSVYTDGIESWVAAGLPIEPPSLP